MALLDLSTVHTYYGNIHALKGISLRVDEGEIVTLIGSNGAGKTTTLKTISGLLSPREGSITLGGKAIHGLPAHEIVALGIGHSPEGRRVFRKMSVKENLEMGAYLRKPGPEVASDLERVLNLFPRLRERFDQKAGTMSGGEQQMLAIGRALMSRPRVLLLDEPSMGLAPILVEQIFEIVREINKAGTTVLLVEQNAMMALAVANRGYIVQTGDITLEDAAGKLANNPKVKEAYLGV